MKTPRPCDFATHPPAQQEKAKAGMARLYIASDVPRQGASESGPWTPASTACALTLRQGLPPLTPTKGRSALMYPDQRI